MSVTNEAAHNRTAAKGFRVGKWIRKAQVDMSRAFNATMSVQQLQQAQLPPLDAAEARALGDKTQRLVGGLLTDGQRKRTNRPEEARGDLATGLLLTSPTRSLFYADAKASCRRSPACFSPPENQRAYKQSESMGPLFRSRQSKR